jgi:hypothetical protein
MDEIRNSAHGGRECALANLECGMGKTDLGAEHVAKLSRLSRDSQCIQQTYVLLPKLVTFL